jgi:hypothetical protein
LNIDRKRNYTTDVDRSELFPFDQPIMRPLVIKFSLIAMWNIDLLAPMNYLVLCRVHPSCQILLDLERTADLVESGILHFVQAHTFC